MVNISNYGAVPNDIDSAELNTHAIRAAIADAGRRGEKVYLPAGKYYVKYIGGDCVFDGAHYPGGSSPQTGLRLMGDGCCDRLTAAFQDHVIGTVLSVVGTLDVPLFKITGSRGFELLDISILGYNRNTPGSTCVHFDRYNSDAVLQNVLIHGFEIAFVVGPYEEPFGNDDQTLWDHVIVDDVDTVFYINSTESYLLKVVNSRFTGKCDDLYVAPSINGAAGGDFTVLDSYVGVGGVVLSLGHAFRGRVTLERNFFEKSTGDLPQLLYTTIRTASSQVFPVVINNNTFSYGSYDRALTEIPWIDVAAAGKIHLTNNKIGIWRCLILAQGINPHPPIIECQGNLWTHTPIVRKTNETGYGQVLFENERFLYLATVSKTDNPFQTAPAGHIEHMYKGCKTQVSWQPSNHGAIDSDGESWEIGSIRELATATPRQQVECIEAGTNGQLPSDPGSLRVLAHTTAGHNTISVNTIGGLAIDRFITIEGVSGFFRILDIISDTDHFVLLDRDVYVTLEDALVQYKNPVWQSV